MRSILTHRKKGGQRTSRKGAPFSGRERRRLMQLGISLAIFALALFGRSAFPHQAEKWSDLLLRDIDLKGALRRFEESSVQGEPFLDALGELCIEVFAAEEEEEVEEGLREEETEGEEKKTEDPEKTPVQRYRIWNEYRESQWRSG